LRVGAFGKIDLYVLVNLRIVGLETLGWLPPAISWRKKTARKSWSVWRGLHLKLSEIEIRPSTIAHSHGFSEAAFGIVAVEGDTIDNNGNNFDDYLNNAAEK
jgi:hypothetical protein